MEHDTVRLVAQVTAFCSAAYVKEMWPTWKYRFTVWLKGK